MPDVVNIFIWLNENDVFKGKTWFKRYILAIAILTILLQLAITLTVILKTNSHKNIAAFIGFYSDIETNKTVFCGDVASKWIASVLVSVIGLSNMEEKVILYFNDKLKPLTRGLLIVQVVTNGLVTISSVCFMFNQTEFSEILSNIPSILFINEIDDYIGAYVMRHLNIHHRSTSTR